MDQIHQIEHCLIDPNTNNPRKAIPQDAIDRMVASQKAKGILIPLKVMPNKGRFTILSGETRWRAAKQAGIDLLPCIVCEGLDEVGVLEDQLSDNLMRSDLPVTDKARGLGRLKLLTGETSKAIAERMGFSPSAVTVCEAILTLPDEMLADIDSGVIGETTAYHLARCTDADLRLELWVQARKGILTRDQVARAVKKQAGTKKPRSTKHVTLAGEEATVKIDLGTSIDEVKKLLGRAYRAAQEASDLEDFRGKFR